jgi:hypothetical protein
MDQVSFIEKVKRFKNPFNSTDFPVHDQEIIQGQADNLLKVTQSFDNRSPPKQLPHISRTPVV